MYRNIQTALKTDLTVRYRFPLDFLHWILANEFRVGYFMGG